MESKSKHFWLFLEFQVYSKKQLLKQLLDEVICRIINV